MAYGRIFSVQKIFWPITFGQMVRCKNMRYFYSKPILPHLPAKCRPEIDASPEMIPLMLADNFELCIILGGYFASIHFASICRVPKCRHSVVADNNQISTFFLFSRNSKLLREWNRAIQNNQAFIRRTYEKVRTLCSNTFFLLISTETFISVQYFFHQFNTGNIPRCKRKRQSEAEDDEDLYEEGTNTNTATDASRSLGRVGLK